MHLITYKVQGMACFFEMSLQTIQNNLNHKKIDIDCIRSRNKYCPRAIITIKDAVDLFKLPFLDSNVEGYVCQFFACWPS